MNTKLIHISKTETNNKVVQKKGGDVNKEMEIKRGIKEMGITESIGLILHRQT